MGGEQAFQAQPHLCKNFTVLASVHAYRVAEVHNGVVHNGVVHNCNGVMHTGLALQPQPVRAMAAARRRPRCRSGPRQQLVGAHAAAGKLADRLAAGKATGGVQAKDRHIVKLYRAAVLAPQQHSEDGTFVMQGRRAW